MHFYFYIFIIICFWLMMLINDAHFILCLPLRTPYSWCSDMSLLSFAVKCSSWVSFHGWDHVSVLCYKEQLPLPAVSQQHLHLKRHLLTLDSVSQYIKGRASFPIPAKPWLDTAVGIQESPSRCTVPGGVIRGPSRGLADYLTELWNV